MGDVIYKPDRWKARYIQIYKEKMHELGPISAIAWAVERWGHETETSLRLLALNSYRKEKKEKKE